MSGIFKYVHFDFTKVDCSYTVDLDTRGTFIGRYKHPAYREPTV